ncbi:MAG: acetoacetate decarboxylase family protein [Proteobacteria bacterium]|nr:acetoacetate decarboxylase family protein [Pseudomonadota bacterium]
MPPRVLGWEYLLVTYRSSAEALAGVLPDGLEPLAGEVVGFEWRRTLSRPTGGERIDAAVVIPCGYKGRELGYELRHYCDQHRPHRIQTGQRCEGGPDFYAKLVAAPLLRMGTLHDGEQLVAAAILSQKASNSLDGQDEAAGWIARPRLKPADLDDAHLDPARHAKRSDEPQLTYQAKGAVTFQLLAAPSGAFVAPAVAEVLYGQFFVAAPDAS